MLPESAGNSCIQRKCYTPDQHLILRTPWPLSRASGSKQGSRPYVPPDSPRISSLALQRIVRLGGAVDDDNSNLLVAQLLYLDSMNHKDITMYINSPGGSVTAGMWCSSCSASTAAILHSTEILPSCSVLTCNLIIAPACNDDI